MKTMKEVLGNAWNYLHSSQAGSDPATVGAPSKQLLWVLLLFFYIPMAYWFGWLEQPLKLIDYPGFYFAAKLAFVDHKTPYGPYVLDVFEPVSGGRIYPYLYPPPSLLAFWPLTRLSLANGHKVFTVVSNLCLLGSIWLMLTRLMPLSRDRWLREITIGLYLVYIMCFDGVAVTYWTGQVNFIILFLICLALAAFKNGSSDWRIALPLSAAILVKVYPVLLLAPLFFRKRFRAITLTCIFIAVFSAVSLFVLPADVWSSWLTKVVPEGGYTKMRYLSGTRWNQNINGFMIRLLIWNQYKNLPFDYQSLAKPLAMVLALAVLAATMFYSFRLARRNYHQQSGDDEMAAFLLMIYLVAPLSWDHHLVYILPACLPALSLLVSGSVRGKAKAAILIALFFIAWKLPFLEFNFQGGWWTLLISLKFYGVAFLWLFFINRLRQKYANSLSPAGILD